MIRTTNTQVRLIVQKIRYGISQIAKIMSLENRQEKSHHLLSGLISPQRTARRSANWKSAGQHRFMDTEEAREVVPSINNILFAFTIDIQDPSRHTKQVQTNTSLSAHRHTQNVSNLKKNTQCTTAGK